LSLCGLEEVALLRVDQAAFIGVEFMLKRCLHLSPGLLACLAVLCTVAFSQNGNQQALESTLERMGVVGKTFQSFEADFSQRQYVAVLKEFDSPESGIFQYARAKDGSALLRQEVKTPGVRILTIKGGVATIFQPKINQATVVNLGKNKDKAEYLALGLGQSPARLREAFEIESLGTEAIDGAPCAVLRLKPRSSAAAAYFSSITLWVKNAAGIPVQQKLQEPNGNYLLVKFTAEKLNRRIPDSQFEPRLPKGVDIQQIR
jgi:outer membrane lipoprotein-sorting protein